MNIIITGGGESKHFFEIDQYFIEQLGDKPRLLYLPFAQKKKRWKDGHERISQTFSSISFSKIRMCKNLKTLDWSTLKKYSAIYIDGGNTFELMHQIRDTHAFELLRRFLHHGGVINGDSAGAITLGSHLETAHFGDIGDENSTSLISYQGLNLLGDWAIHCHYQESENKEISDFSKTYGFPVLALSENTAVAINNKQVRVIGEAPLVIFDQEKIDYIIPGDSFTL